MTGAPAHHLEWDSTFFDRRVARVAATRLTSDSLAALLDWCRSESIEWLYFLADADDDATVQLAEGAGFHQVDIRVELDLAPVPATRPAHADTFALRVARPDDLAALRPIAAAGHIDTRYFFDPRVSSDRATALYETWLERSILHAFADVVLVAEIDGTAVGYITGKLRDGEASIGLFGVGEAARGKGVGTALVYELFSWARSKGAERITVVTQGRNVAAQRIYQKCGFLTRSVHLWYHLWPSR